MMVGYLLVVSLALALAAPAVRSMFWGVPFGLLSVGIVVRTVVSTALTTLAAGALATGCFAWTSRVPDVYAGALGASAGGVVGLGLLLISVTRRRRLRGAIVLAQRLHEPAVRDTALGGLRALLGRAYPRAKDADLTSYANLVLLVIGPMTQAGLWDEAETLLEELPPERMAAHAKALRAQALATCRLQRDDVNGARDAIESIERPAAEPAVETWIATTEALVLAVEGRADEALARVGTEERDGADPLVTSSERIVRAHAFAARGETDRAREALLAVRADLGPAALERAMHPRGPASDLARAIQQT